MAADDAARAAELILIAHQRHRGGCLCGWAELGKSLPGHQVAMLREAGLVPLAEVLDALRDWQRYTAWHGELIAPPIPLREAELAIAAEYLEAVLAERFGTGQPGRGEDDEGGNRG